MALATLPSGLLTPKEAAAWLGVTTRTLFNLDLRVVKVGRLNRYDVRDLQQYADMHGNRPRLERTA